MKWLKALLISQGMVEYRLCEEDRELLESIQFDNVALHDAMQALISELSATRVVMETIAERLVQKDGDTKEGKGRTDRPVGSKDNQGTSKGPL